MVKHWNTKKKPGGLTMFKIEMRSAAYAWRALDPTYQSMAEAELAKFELEAGSKHVEFRIVKA